MEIDNEEIVQLRETLSEILKDFEYIGVNLVEKSKKLQDQIENTNEFTLDAFENVGQKIAATLSKLKGNSIIYLNTLLNNLNSINSNRKEKIFSAMVSKLHQSRSNTLFKQNGKYVFAQLVEKETSTDNTFSERECKPSTSNPKHMDKNNDSQPSTSNIYQDNQNCTHKGSNFKEKSDHENDKCKPSTSKLSDGDQNGISYVQVETNLSLRRETTTDTIKTDDSWRDTLQRNIAIVENTDDSLKDTLQKSPILGSSGVFEKSLELDEDIKMERNVFNSVRTLFDPKKEDDDKEADELFKECQLSGIFTTSPSSTSKSSLGFKTKQRAIDTTNFSLKKEQSFDDQMFFISSSDDEIYSFPTQPIKNPDKGLNINKLLPNSRIIDKKRNEISAKSVNEKQALPKNADSFGNYEKVTLLENTSKLKADENIMTENNTAIKREKCTFEKMDSQEILNNQNNSTSRKENTQKDVLNSSSILGEPENSKDHCDEISNTSTDRLSYSSSSENLTDKIDSPHSPGKEQFSSLEKNVNQNSAILVTEESEPKENPQPSNNLMEVATSNSAHLEVNEKTDRQSNEIEDYPNPYSVETEKLSSDGDDCDVKSTPESPVKNENYSETQLLQSAMEEEYSETQRLSEEIQSIPKRLSGDETNEKQSPQTPEQSSDKQNDSEAQVTKINVSDGDDCKIQLTPSCLSGEHNSEGQTSECKSNDTRLTQKCATEETKESEIQLNTKNTDLYSEHSYSSVSTSELEDSPKSTDHTTMIINESDCESEKNIEVSKSDKEKVDTDSDTGKNVTSTNDHIFSEHNYSSSNSINNDETDIENVPEKPNDIKLNVDNFNFEVTSTDEDAGQSFTSSNKSFEFDVNNSRHPENNDEDQSDEPVEKLVNELEQILSSTDVDKSAAVSPNNANSEEKEVDKSDDKNVQKEDDLLDVTMEEILSDCEIEKKTSNSSQETIPYCYVKEIKSEHSDVDETVDASDEDKLLKDEEEEINKSPKPIEAKDLQSQSNIADELLELLKDIPDSPIKTFPVSQETNIEVVDESAEIERALLNLNEDTSEISDSAETSSIDDLSNLSISSIDDVEFVDENKENNNEDSKMAHMLSCYVPLERMKLSQKAINKFKKTLENEVDWLCNLDILSNKRKTATSPRPCDKRPQKKLRTHFSNSSSNSSSDFSSDDESNIDDNVSLENVTLNVDQEKRLDDILAKVVCNQLKSGSGGDSDDTDSGEDGNRKKKKRKKANNGDDESANKKLSKEELEKKAWMKDPLLRGKLTSSESSDSETSVKKRKRKRYEDDTEFAIHSETLESDSDAEEIRENNKSKLLKNEISPIKKNVPLSDPSDSDDVQYVSPAKTLQQDTNQDDPSPSQKGRRNIRSIVDDQFLAEATKKAKKEELERIDRLKSRHSLFESLSQSYNSQLSESYDDVPPLVLDVDEKSGTPIVQVNQVINKKLKPHQRNGIKFMWDSCYESINHIKTHRGSGCILAHCMGLGKTMQVLTLIQTLFSYDETEAKHILVVCPLSTVNNWKQELKFVFKGLPKDQQFALFIFPNTNCAQRCAVVKSWHLRKKAVLVVGYESFELVTNETKLDKKVNSNLKAMILEALVNPGPDLVVCDEGHLIKNKKAMRSQALNKIRTKRRIVLTGTPLQNNLIEYYHMVHFVKPNLLGTLQEFKTNFVNPITNGQYEDSTEDDIKLMRSRTHVLHEILKETVQRVEDSELEIYLPSMVDHAVFVQLHQVQVDLYNQFCNNVKNSLEKVGKRFFSDFHMLQYLCSHPHLLVLMEASKNKKLKQQDVVCEDVEIGNIENWWKDKLPPDSLDKIDYGPKFVVLRSILEECEEVGDKLLVFSQKIAELNLIEHFLKTVGTAKCPSWKRGVHYCRMDGTVIPEKRAIICDTFNDKNKKSIRLLLMTTQVGGLGLNLTAANRVVIMTVNWNPSYDTQSVFRAYRFGQTKQVYVYRLISLDTMEEKVYQRSVTKLAIAHRVVDKHQIDRHYKSVDLQELYDCRPTADNERPTLNVPEDDMLARLILKLPCIFKFHEHKALLVNRQEHKLTEQEKEAAWEEYKNKDKPKLPPPQPQQQQTIQNGPTFEQGFNLGRHNLNQVQFNRAVHEAKFLNWATYYLPDIAHVPSSTLIPGTTISLDEDLPSTSTSGQTGSILPRPNVPTGNQIPSTSNLVQAASRLSRNGSMSDNSGIPSTSTSGLPRQASIPVENRVPNTSTSITPQYNSNVTSGPWVYTNQQNLNVPLAAPSISTKPNRVHIKQIKTKIPNKINPNRPCTLKQVPITLGPTIELDSPTKDVNNINTSSNVISVPIPSGLTIDLDSPVKDGNSTNTSSSTTPSASIVNPVGITNTVVPNPFGKKIPKPNQNVDSVTPLQRPNIGSIAQPVGVQTMVSSRWYNEP